MSMIGKPGYKETEIGWLPQSWSLNTLENLATDNITYGVVQPGIEVDGGIPLVRGGDVKDGRVAKKLRTVSSEISKQFSRTVLRGGELLVSLVGSPGETAIAPISLAGANIARQVGLVRLGNTVAPHFVQQYLNSPIGKEILLGGMIGSAQQVINLNALREVAVPVPPSAEQQKIAAILTAVDDKLDVIVRQIEATQTLKRGLMQTLFSQGVGTQDANGQWQRHTEFKDSELGAIPAGWRVERLEDLSQAITVGIATSTTEHYVEDGVPLVRNQNIKEDFLDMSDLLQISPDFDVKNKTKRVLPGDILTVRTGYPGVSCVVPEGLGHVQTFTTLITRPTKTRVNSDFVSRYFNSPQGKALMLHEAAGGAQQNINAGNLKKLLVPEPPLPEQRVIAEILSSVDMKIRALQSKEKHHQTLKRGLMQKLLTGEWRVKVDAVSV